MNGIYDGVITKPELNEETLTHYGIAKKVHKYIDKYLKNGKWIYRYKSKAQELGAKAKRTLNGIDPETPTKYGLTIGDNNGKANSHSGKINLVYQNPKDRKARFDAGISAGRKRAAKKGYKVNTTKKPRSRKKTTTSGKVKVYKRSIK